MTYYQDEWLSVYGGDCRAVMAELPAESVHCVVTSPPYWGLRDYGTATWDGGDADCDHVERMARGDSGRVSTDDRPGNINPAPVDTPMRFKGACRKCGAVRQDSQLGLEATPEEYVANLVDVFRGVRRVLRADGTVWLNLGDSYAAGGTGGYSNKSTLSGFTSPDTKGRVMNAAPISRAPTSGLKPKDLVGIPWRVAFALQADGWYLRSDIIWSKPNPMPESVTDRPTKSHEYIYLLSKSPRYYFDADAVREPHVRIWDPEAKNGSINARRDDASGIEPNPAGRNLRSVWTIATQPYPGAHFATFPRKLVEPCIKAGTSERGVCPECGAPWERVVDVVRGVRDDSTRDPDKRAARRGMLAVPEKGWESDRTTTGWQPTCRHDADPVPAVCLDPFAGSGTTGVVAQSLGRRAVLIDLNPDYLAQAMRRNRDIPLGLVG